LLQLAIEPSTALLKKNIGPHLLCPPLLIVQLAASILDALKGYLPASFALAQTAYFRGVEATVRGGNKDHAIRQEQRAGASGGDWISDFQGIGELIGFSASFL